MRECVLFDSPHLKRKISDLKSLDFFLRGIKKKGLHLQDFQTVLFIYSACPKEMLQGMH